jgi:hypothetical protein
MKPLILGLLVSLLAACGGSSAKCDTANLAVSCVSAASGLCTDYTGLSSSDSTSIQNQCFNAHNTFSSSACNTANRVGTCTIPDSTPGSNVLCATGSFAIRFYSPNFTAATAQSACSSFQGGTFTSG